MKGHKEMQTSYLECILEVLSELLKKMGTIKLVEERSKHTRMKSSIGE
jgi:hypothetical protein